MRSLKFSAPKQSVIVISPLQYTRQIQKARQSILSFFIQYDNFSKIKSSYLLFTFPYIILLLKLSEEFLIEK